MKCLTVRNPWALAIFYCGKDIENRDWYTGVRGTVAIHAGAGMTKTEYNGAFDNINELGFTPPTFEECNASRGMVLGTVEIVDCVRDSDSPWFFGKYGFVLRNQKRFDTPIPARGSLGFWDWDDGSVKEAPHGL